MQNVQNSKGYTVVVTLYVQTKNSTPSPSAAF